MEMHKPRILYFAPSVQESVHCKSWGGHLDKARYEAEYWFFENLVNMVNAENMVNVVNIIKAQEEKMKVIYEFSKTR